ncbi:hypothetical protein N7475_006742 [Penicillium sp. IBT 31633x]|nr:hypothetical protein N7475_006742 [Penicillium sp. IBT 31633x]
MIFLSLLALLAPSVCLAACPYAHLAERDVEISVKARSDAILPRAVPGKKGIMLMNRINPSSSELYIANADGSNERSLLGDDSVFEYHASFSPDGKHVIFTTERNGDGNSDLYMVNVDGTGLTPVATTPSVEDAAVISPDGKYAAYASTASVYTSNIWLKNLETGFTRNLTNQTGVTGKPESPNGFFAPAWSPDGKWIVFSSDRNTAWTGHDNGTGWEHSQELAIYAITPKGTGFRKLYGKPGYTYGSPRFSPDGKRVTFYEMDVQTTWDSRSSFSVNSSTSQIVSVDFKTGTDFKRHTETSGIKIYPQYVSNKDIGYLLKGGDEGGIHYTSSSKKILGGMRSPAWSADGKHVVYEKTGWETRPLQKELWSWDSEWDYRFMDVFPAVSLQGELAFTIKQTGSPGNSSVGIMPPGDTDFTVVFDTYETGQLDDATVSHGGGGAFQPSWSADGEWLTFGLGSWFQSRGTAPGWIYRAKADGSSYEQLTFGGNTTNKGFPSFSPDGKQIVYREWTPEVGLRLLDLETNETTTLTTERDNLPFFSPDGEWVLFTRNMTDLSKNEFSNYEVCIMHPDGTDLTVLTTSYANDAHAVWTADGRIMWSSGMWGFQAEAATYDDTFQPYGQIMIMDVDGSNKTVLTDSLWEDSMPVYVPNSFLS